MPQVKRGSTVLVHYTAMLKNRKIVESTAGSDPVRLTVGAGKALRGLEEALEGMSPGESKWVTVPPERAYGRRKPSGATHLSQDAAAPLGDRPARFQQQVVTGMAPGDYTVTSTDRGIVVDNNPHLAGEELILEIELVDILT
ncbi:FKBP-type peptidyl-prolyl cis-trans isomerase [Geotalea sp. SG265]|uniref:FKBP-type peptidyl-prolyl cis-trans isomerase n=1 Tax=Geotalea sp. SG265 TaxID=2922867 RepID=UPI001FAF8220|nr:FKBP-type peptidyl-prolyl cis-trans isomerase [Geotalea sp. SG265]